MIHLILHKVRGEPSFDIATQFPMGDEMWWIIPTSGHRAYPAAWWPLSEVLPGHERHMSNLNLSMFRDHYSVNDEKLEIVTAKVKRTAVPLTLDDLD